MARVLSSRPSRRAQFFEGEAIPFFAGPRESPVGRGPGITEKAGRYSGDVIDLATNPDFVEYARPGLQSQVRRRVRELDNNGARGKYTGAAGFSADGSMQFIGAMDPGLYKVLMWTDPTLFEDEKRLIHTLKKMGLAAPGLS